MKKIFAIVICVLLMMAFASCANINKTDGEFYGGGMELTDMYGITDTYYQFKSYDNMVWWLLTADEIGFVPNEDTEYILIYDDNGTTMENKSEVCDCPAEWECECELYDDIFWGVIKK